MSFGFGVGDFIAVATLTAKIIRSLRETTGSSQDFQHLVLTFDTFGRLVKTVQQQFKSGQLPQPVINAISIHVARSESLLQKFNEKTTKYRGSLSDAGSGKKLQDSWRKIGWGLYKRQELLELSDGLAREIDAIHLLLSCHTSSAVVCVGTQILKRIERAIPQGLQPWSDYMPVQFLDALEAQVELPFEICCDFQSFTNLLKIYFRDRPGSHWVGTGSYEILNEEDQGTLTIQNWKQTVVPNTKLSMSIILKQQKSFDQARDCPSCGAAYEGYGKIKDLERVRCLKCRTWFQISSQARVEQVPDEVDSTSAGGVGGKAASSKDSAPIGKDELKHIRRFHVLYDEAQLNESWVSSIEPVICITAINRPEARLLRDVSEGFRTTLRSWGAPSDPRMATVLLSVL